MELKVLSLLVIVAVASAAVTNHDVNLDDGSCDSRVNLEFGDVASVITDGRVPVAFGEKTCTVEFTTSDPNNQCQKTVKLCVMMEKVTRMCYALATFSSSSKTDLVLDCTTTDLPMEWCANGHEVTRLIVEEHPNVVLTENNIYSFSAKLFTRCTNATYQVINKGAQSETIDPVTFADVEDAIHENRVIGIIVGVCLASMFLVALLITYFYYKNKAYIGVPRN